MVRAVNRNRPRCGLIPVSVFWGRTPEKEDSGSKWAVGNVDHRGTLSSVRVGVVNGRNLLVQFARADIIRTTLAI